MKKKSISISGFLAAALAVPLILGGVATTFAEETEQIIRISKEFTTTNQADDGKNQFHAIYEQGGKRYHLEVVEVRKLKEKVFPKEALAYDSEGFTGDPKNHRPPDTMERDGKTYKLADCQLVDTIVEERTKAAKSTILYHGVEFIDTLPEVGTVEVTDEDTGQKIMAQLPIVSHKEQAAYWDSGFTFPITVAAYDAEIYTMGEMEIPRGADLNQYGGQFLSYLGLPETCYRVDRIEWKGEPYTQAGEIMRDAVAYGEKLVKDIHVVYGGDISLPAIGGKLYQCIYAAVDQWGAVSTDTTVYTMEATATYQSDHLKQESGDSLADRLAQWLVSHSTMVVSISLMFLIMILLALFWIGKKRKKR